MNGNRAIVFFLCLIAVACNDESGDGDVVRHVKAPEMWMDYQLWGEEGKENVTVMLQFRTERAEKSTALLEKPSQVELDGEALDADSSKMSGYYYETVKPVTSFAGQHSILFRDDEGKKYEEKFNFQPFRLKKELPEKVSRKGIAIELEGLEKESYIRVIAIDTVFYSNGINAVDTVRDGQLILSEKRLKNLKNGPIHIELYREDEYHVKNRWKGGGRISMTYGLKRDFELTD